jgi:monoamine oxidase
MNEETVQAFVCSVRSAFSVEPRELSFFYLLYYAACAGSYSALVDVAGGPGAAEGARLPRGTQEVVARLRAEVEAPGAQGSIEPSVRITQIHQEPSSVTVVASNGRSWRARQVIMAMSPATVGDMSHATSVPGMDDAIGRRQQLEAAMRSCQGRTIKGFVKFKGPFWRTQRVGPREQGLMGFFLSAGNQGNPPNHASFPLDWTLDNVWEDPRTLEQRASLMTFIVGDAASYWQTRTRDQRAQAVIDHLRRVFGFTDADLLDSNNVLSNYVERNWPAAGNTQFLPSPAAMFPPDGSFTHTFPALRQAIGRVHYAGSESALEWNGYMNGAVQSGFRAASEVLTALALPSP